MDEETVAKETPTSLYKDISNKINNNTNDHQDNLIDSECFDNVPLKYASKIGQFQDYSK